MADGIDIKDAANTTVPVHTDEVTFNSTSKHMQIIKLAIGALNAATLLAGGAGAVDAGTLRATLASDDPAVASLALMQASLSVLDDWDNNDALKAVGVIAVPSANFTRPPDTAAYASGDLVANSTTAGSVAALSWSTAARYSGGSAIIRRARLKSSSTSLTNASYRLHLYGSDPTASSGITNGDNGVWLTKVAGYLGSIDIIMDKAFSDASAGQGVPAVGSEIAFIPGSGSTIYGLLEARAARTPANAEVFTCDLEIMQN